MSTAKARKPSATSSEPTHDESQARVTIKPRALGEVAPSMLSLTRVTGGSTELDKWAAIAHIHRAQAILRTFTATIQDEDADDRYVLWTVDALLLEASEIVEYLDCSQGVTP